jgi:hypothetical protein
MVILSLAMGSRDWGIVLRSHAGAAAKKFRRIGSRNRLGADAPAARCLCRIKKASNFCCASDLQIAKVPIEWVGFRSVIITISSPESPRFELRSRSIVENVSGCARIKVEQAKPRQTAILQNFAVLEAPWSEGSPCHRGLYKL